MQFDTVCHMLDKADKQVTYFGYFIPVFGQNGYD